MTQSTV